jgi:hypothetical protein
MPQGSLRPQPDHHTAVQLLGFSPGRTGLHAFAFLPQRRLVEAEVLAGRSHLEGLLLALCDGLLEVLREGDFVLDEIVKFELFVHSVDLLLFEL